MSTTKSPHTPASPTPATRILRKRDVLLKISVSSTTLWRMQRAGIFPKSFPISRGLVGWRESDIDAWIDRRSKSRTALPVRPV